MVPELQNRTDDGAQATGHNTYFAWLVVLSAAVVIDQLTGNALLAAAIPCAHAAWKSLRCGFWLLSADPVASRGRVCFCFYFATACWKASACALATMAMLVLIDGLLGRVPPLEEVVVELAVLFGGLCLSTVIGIVSVVLAMRSRMRVWVHPNVRERCRGDFSTIRQYGRSYPGLNQAMFVVSTSLVLPAVVLGMVFLACTTVGAQPNDPLTAWGVLVILLVFVCPAAMIPLYAFVSSRVIARTPADCWPPPVP